MYKSSIKYYVLLYCTSLLYQQLQYLVDFVKLEVKGNTNTVSSPYVDPKCDGVVHELGSSKEKPKSIEC